MPLLHSSTLKTPRSQIITPRTVSYGEDYFTFFLTLLIIYSTGTECSFSSVCYSKLVHTSIDGGSLYWSKVITHVWVLKKM